MRPGPSLDSRPDSILQNDRQHPQKSAMNIGQLARQAGVPIDTVRYYEQQLLPTAARSAGGYASSASRTCAGCDSSAAPRHWASAGRSAICSTERSPLTGHGQRARYRAGTPAGHLTANGAATHAHAQLVDACPGHGTLDQCPILAALTTLRRRQRTDIGVATRVKKSATNACQPPGARLFRPQRRGAIAQLGERLHGMQEVSGSIPLGSTNLSALGRRKVAKEH